MDDCNNSKFVIFLDFHSTKQGLPSADSWLHDLDKNQMYPDPDKFEQQYPAQDTLQHMIKAWWKMARQKAGKTLSVFSFVNKHSNTNMKPFS